MSRDYSLLTALRAAILAFVVTCCTDGAKAPAQQAVDDWMGCIECIDDELDRVVAFGSLVVPVLGAYAAYGPPGEHLDSVRAGENASYLRVIAAGMDTSRIRNLADVYVSNAIALYQARSGVALRRIGGPSAIQAFDQALAQPLRPDVRSQLMALRDSTIP